MRKSKRKALLGVLIIVLLVGSIGLFMKNETNTLNSNSIKEGITKELDDNLIGAYIQQGEEYVKADTIPTSGYEFNAEESYCKIGDVVQEDMTLFYDMDTQSLTVSPIAKEGTKCYLYFDEKASGGDYILAGDNPPTGTITDWTGGTSYYYTGNPNNWVQFAGFWWRIIRINGDGSIRMIYQGKSANTTGTGTQLYTVAFNLLNDDNAYVGYMYTENQVHGTGSSSTIKGALDQWYSGTSGLTAYAEYIDGNAGFCGDRTPYSGSGIGGGISLRTYYAAYNRLVNNNNPSLQCSDSGDIYTTSGSSTGNGALTYPIGLISADEVVLAGLPYYDNGSNTNNYLYTGQLYWTMSPYNFYGGGTYEFVVYGNGSLYGYQADSRRGGARPVINLKADTPISGSGTTTDPFKVAGT